MSKSPDIIEAVPQSEKRKHNRSKKIIYAGVGGIVAAGASFFIGIKTPYVGELAYIWGYATLIGVPVIYFKYLRGDKLELMDKMEKANLATYTVGGVVEESATRKGRNRLLRLMPPGLRAGIPIPWHK